MRAFVAFLPLTLTTLLACGGEPGNGGGSGGTAGVGGSSGNGGVVTLLWPCTEEGIRDAIMLGGGPHTFACDGPTVVPTEDTIEVIDDVILDGEGNLTIDGQGSHTVFFLWRGSNTELRGLTVTGGYTPGVGGGIRNAGDLLIDGCSIVENRSDQGGGGIQSSDGRLEIINSVISGNQAERGGGIFSFGDATIRESMISENVGGGISSGGTLSVQQSTITGNRGAFSGGGISGSGDVVVVSSTISSNEAQLGGGVATSGYAGIFTTTVSGNTADEGGGVYAFDAQRLGGDLSISELGVLDIQFSTVSGNTAQRGAGVYSLALRMAAWNSTISGNVASEAGGGLYIGGTTLGASTYHLTHDTIAENTAPLGSALYGTGETPTVRFSGNIVEGDCYSTGDTVVLASLGSNIESPGNSCNFSQPSDRTDRSSAELLLGPLADNGGDGDTETHLPMAGSIAIDMIPEEQCQEVLPVTPLLDQRLVQRPQGSGCDPGSVEATD